MSVVLLSRIQFALTVMFHYLFPPLSIGLGLLLVVMEGMFLRTGDRLYETMTRFWTKVFAVNFAMGVATGLVMEFEFGTNWAAYARYVGDIFGSALAAEGIFAFFLESGFLAVLVFGWDRVSSRTHFFSTCMVSLGSIFSSVWIVIANSWQQTPAGFHIVGEGLNARAEITDFWQMVFNPSAMVRLTHVLFGAFILGAFFVMSICAWYVLRERHLEFAKRCFTLALVVATIASCAELLAGHASAKSIAEHQPAKLAAFEGHFRTGEGGTGLYVIGLPDPEEERVKYGIEIPYLLSVLVHEDPNKPVTGLDQIKPEDRPPIVLPFMTYHVMIGIGTILPALVFLAWFLRWRGKLFGTKWLMKIFVVAVVLPYAANQTGWISAEVGRQPWVVYGLLRTSDAVSKAVAAHQIVGSIVMFTLIYALLFAVWIYVLNSKIQHGPEEHRPTDEPPPQTRGPEFLEAAAQLANPSGPSMTSAKG
ncbi:MAG: cytochrome ubiquinol oxidase subunit I [Polyangiaceae bacterium]